MDLQAQVIQQRTEISQLEGSASQGVEPPAPAAAPAGVETSMQKINELTATVARLMSMVEARNGPVKPASNGSGAQEIAEDDFINISFDR
jgi:hypothetical protein